MALTITIPGAVSTTTGSTAPAILTVGVGSPGVGVPSGGTTGQVLAKASGVSYDTAWLTLPADFITSVSAPLAVASGVLSVDLSAYSTTAQAAALYYPLSGNPSGFLTASALTPYLTSASAASTYQTLSGMSSYLTTSAAASTYAPIAAGQPTSGTVGQVLTKQSGTNYDSIWSTPVVGDRYLTTSTTSNTLSNTNKTFTIGTGLSYTPTQSITISYDAGNHMHGEVLTYNSGTGVLTVDINHHTGSGTYAAWVVNVGGVVPATSVAWGAITGTLSTQTDLQNALDAKLSLAGGAMTGSITSSNATYDTEMAGDLFGVQLSADHTQGTTVEFDGIDTYNSAGHMTVTPTGLTFPDGSVQTWACAGGLRYQSALGSAGLISSAEIVKLFYAYNSTYTFPSSTDDPFFPPCELTFLITNAGGWANFTISPTVDATFKGGITQMYGVGVVKAICMTPGSWLIYGDLSWIPYGTVISSSCTSTDGYDANNVYWSGAWYQNVTIWDGAGGTIDTSGNNQGGCFYPAGYCTALGASTDNDSGYVDDSSNIMYYWSYVGATVENGSGGSSTVTVNRPVGSTISVTYTYNGSNVYFAANGSGGFVLTNV